MLSHAINVLQNNSNLPSDSIQLKLLVLIHLMEDIYQPLHTGCAEDKGGNDYQTSFLGKDSNLHRVWDSEIIKNENISLEDCLAVVEKFSYTERQ